MARHGIFITEHKKFNTKTIYNKGRVVMRYSHCPKHLKFSSFMVNDINQHLCGGWAFSDLGTSEELQLLNREKPFGVILGSIEHLKVQDKNLQQAGLLTKIVPNKFGGGRHLEACHQMLVNEIGDLKMLISDYLDAGFDVSDEVKAVGLLPLSTFFNCWDVNDGQPLWLTGVLLGYPVENTISIMWKMVNQ